jgi:hypothetical protein
MELPAAAATVADVNFRLTLYRLKLSVLLEISEEYVQKKKKLCIYDIWMPYINFVASLNDGTN